MDAYLAIEDRLDAIGQKHRLVRIVRGVMLWTTWGGAAAVAAALGADVAGQGILSLVVAVMLIAWLAASAALWMVRPVFTRTSPVAVARLVERRIDGLHNGLSNSVLLAQARDIAANPWLGQIYQEILDNCRGLPLEKAVRFADLGGLAARLAGVLGVAVLTIVLAPAHLAHGWQQMMSPGGFVPKAGDTEIVEVRPGDVTLVAGEPLEIGVVVKGVAASRKGAIYFNGQRGSRELSLVEPGRYAYQIPHVDVPLKYRVEIGGTQSGWYSVQVAPKVSLTGLELTITPPSYTRQPARTIKWKAGKAVAVPLGSKMEIGAEIDVPLKRGLLLMNAKPPVEMNMAREGKRFYREMTIATDATAFVGLMAGDRMIARLPEDGVQIRAINDAPPIVTMQWPMQDVVVPPTQELTVKAAVQDDYGITAVRLLVGVGDGELAVWPGSERRFDGAGGPAGGVATAQTVQLPLSLTAEQTADGESITVAVEASDNRDLTELSSDLGPQATRGPKLTIRFQSPARIAQDQGEQLERLTRRLREMIQAQQSLRDKSLPRPVDRDAIAVVGKGQDKLRQTMRSTCQEFEFSQQTRIVKTTLEVLAANTASEAVELAQQIASEPVLKEQTRETEKLNIAQASITETLQALLARLSGAVEPTTRPDVVAGGTLPARIEAFKKLDDALKQYEKEQKRLLDQTAPLAKKPVDDYSAAEKKKLDDLRMAQDKLDAFMQERLADFSKNDQQDMSNPSLVKDLTQMYSQITMAKDALAKPSAEKAVSLEDMGLEMADSIKTNIEKWLDNAPDRTEWTQEDPVAQTELPEAELPKEMQDMIGQLLEQEEDIDQKAEDANANWHDSMDTAIGWNALDGPISDMSAKGITSNVLPNNNEMQGRSGEGRSGKSSGEFVGDQASGKGGRNTPTRLDPTPFQSGQIKSTDTDPAGGATGGGKITGQGAAGLEGPVPPKLQAQMQRLSKMQAQLRNTAERLNLQYKLGRYDNFKLMQGIVDMRRVESDIDANRYQNALRRMDVIVSDLTASQVLVGGGMNVQHDSSEVGNQKVRKEIQDAEQGELPPVWSDSLREYYRKLAEE